MPVSGERTSSPSSRSCSSHLPHSTQPAATSRASGSWASDTITVRELRVTLVETQLPQLPDGQEQESPRRLGHDRRGADRGDVEPQLRPGDAGASHRRLDSDPRLPAAGLRSEFHARGPGGGGRAFLAARTGGLSQRRRQPPRALPCAGRGDRRAEPQAPARASGAAGTAGGPALLGRRRGCKTAGSRRGHAPLCRRSGCR